MDCCDIIPCSRWTLEWLICFVRIQKRVIMAWINHFVSSVHMIHFVQSRLLRECTYKCIEAPMACWHAVSLLCTQMNRVYMSKVRCLYIVDRLVLIVYASDIEMRWNWKKDLLSSFKWEVGHMWCDLGESIEHVTFSVFYSTEVLIRSLCILLKPQVNRTSGSKVIYSNWKILKIIENKRNTFLFVIVSQKSQSRQCSRLPSDPARLQHILIWRDNSQVDTPLT